ncbi:MAG: DUF2971 domain-containing protein [Clostridiales Family XIII bacterium]|jgi:hypothetical protein|nr:DUF2971 domain-containing protein [Clostridiales Family XIII bacterium]
MIYYKYRSLENFGRIVDIFLNNRLYAAGFNEQNDFREGIFTFLGFDRTKVLDELRVNDTEMSSDLLSLETREKLLEWKCEFRILSLSKTDKSQVMWSHYADNHKGIVIGVEIDTDNYRVEEIIYKEIPHLSNCITINEETALRILKHKSEEWLHEKEVRVFTKAPTKTVNVKISEVIIGCQMDLETKELLKSIIQYTDDDRDKKVIIKEDYCELHKFYKCGTTESTCPRDLQCTN